MSAAWRSIRAWLAMMLALAACVSRAGRDALPELVDRAARGGRNGTQARGSGAAAQSDWSLPGRIAVSNGSQGRQRSHRLAAGGRALRVALSAPVTRQSWRLSAATTAGRGWKAWKAARAKASMPAQLLREATGWEIPVRALADWVRGCVRTQAPDGPVRRRYGRRTGGWTSPCRHRTGWAAIEYGSAFAGCQARLPSDRCCPAVGRSARRGEAQRAPGHPTQLGDLLTLRPERRPVARMTANAGWSAWPAPAKLNLFLRITGRRADGYHALQTVFRLLDWGDTIRLRVRDDGQIVRHRPVGRRGRRGRRSDGSCGQIAAIGGQRLPRCRHHPSKSAFLPAAASAAARPMPRPCWWRWTGCGALDLGVDRLAELGLQLGADVPVFVRGDNAWAEGVGEAADPDRAAAGLVSAGRPRRPRAHRRAFPSP